MALLFDGAVSGNNRILTTPCYIRLLQGKPVIIPLN
jgi:hypothetical protein